MRKIVLASFLALSTLGALAQGAEAARSPELLSIQYVSEGAATVALPTVRNTDGTICTSYISSAAPGKDGVVDTAVRQICGGADTAGSRPAKLTALENYTANGLTIQLPTIHVGQ